jgi:SRSO17 transposase
MDVAEMEALQTGLGEFLRAFGPAFKQERTRAMLRAYGVGLLSDVRRKSVEPMALAAGCDERAMQLFLSHCRWSHERVRTMTHHRIAARDDAVRIGVIDATGHPKRGEKTPGVQHQWCGQTGKQDNCVVGQHLLYTNNDGLNPFSCMLASDLFLPDERWSQDRERCREAGIPDTLVHRPKWRIAVEQIEQVVGNGVRLDWWIGDSDYGTQPGFWFELDRLGQCGVFEVSPRMCVWATVPSCRSERAEHISKRVDNLVTYSPAFTEQPWVTVKTKMTTTGPKRWEVKAAPIRLVAKADPTGHGKSTPTDRSYWLIAARNPNTREMKYIVSNALAATVEQMLGALSARWHVEKWFERAKQQAGLGAFEVRTYTSLIRHWLISGLVMLFLAEQTESLRKKTRE